MALQLLGGRHGHVIKMDLQQCQGDICKQSVTDSVLAGSAEQCSMQLRPCTSSELHANSSCQPTAGQGLQLAQRCCLQSAHMLGDSHEVS